MWKEFKKQFIPNTITFISIVSFITVFKTFFGDENSLVGVTIVTACLILLGTDLTKEPWKNFIGLLAINVIMGVMAHYANKNLWLGVILNFITIFAVAYICTENLTKRFLLPFGLEYLFMLYAPVEGYVYYQRIEALAVGSGLIMLLQFFVHGLKKKKAKVTQDVSIQSSSSIKSHSHQEIQQQKLARIIFALKLAVLTTIATFINQLFGFVEGRWMVYTIFSVTEITIEQTVHRAKIRVKSTIIGIIIVFLSFLIVRNSQARMLIMLFAGYLNSYFSDYRYVVVIITISAVVSESMTHNSVYVMLMRLLFICFGVIFALIGNHFHRLEKRIPSILKSTRKRR